MPSKVWYFLYFPKNVTYLDQSIFYYGDVFKKYIEEYLLDKKVIAISRKGVIDYLKNDIKHPLTDMAFIETPATNAFSEYPRIAKELSALIEHNNTLPAKKEVVVLAAFGPASKVLAYDFATNGSQATVIDIGVGLEIIYSDRTLERAIFPEYAVD